METTTTDPATFRSIKTSLRALRALETETIWLNASHMHNAKVLPNAYEAETETGLVVVFIVRESILWDGSVPDSGYTVAAIDRRMGTVVQLSARAEYVTVTEARRAARAVLSHREPARTLRGELLRAHKVEVRMASYFDKKNGNPYVAWALVVDGTCRLRQGVTYGGADDALDKLNAVLKLGRWWRVTAELLQGRGVALWVERLEFGSMRELRAYAERLPRHQLL